MQIASAPTLRREQDLDGPDRRSERPARGRDAALHDHGQEHRHRQRDRRACCATSAGEHDLRRRQHEAERRRRAGVLAASRRSQRACRSTRRRIRRRASCAPMRRRRRATSPRSSSTSSSTRTSLDGTVISNQGFVSAVAAGVIDQPSDDPDTPTVERSDARHRRHRAAAVRARSARRCRSTTARPASSIRATCCATRSRSTTTARSPATDVVLRDAVPANTTYVADSTTLNGCPSASRTAASRRWWRASRSARRISRRRCRAPAQGTLSAGESAVVQFDLRVNDGVPARHCHQQPGASSTSDELPDLLTDGDGNPATGPEPTIVVVGNAPAAADHQAGRGRRRRPGARRRDSSSTSCSVTNVATVPALYVVITDDLERADAGLPRRTSTSRRR